jgi:integrase
VKLDARTIAGLSLGDKKDVIHFDSTLRGFGFRLRLSRDGKRTLRSWVLQYRANGRGRRFLIGPADVLSADAARDKAKKILGKVWDGQDPQADKTERREKDRDRFDAVVAIFLAAKKPNVRPGTFSQLRRYLADGPWLKEFHAKPLDRITRKDVAARILRITNESGPAQACEVRSALSGFYVWAMHQGLAEANPVIGTERPKTNGARERVLSDDELAAIWNACRDDEYGKIIRLLILTACRRAEIGDLCWKSEVDLDKATLTISASRSKNHRAHTLPIMPMMREIIESVPRMASRDALFGRRGRGFTAWSWKDCKPRLDQVSGVQNWRVHDLRRSVATKMADIGVQPHIIEAVIGHYSGHRAGVAGIYNRSSYEREVRAALATWHDHLRIIIGGGERKVVHFAPKAAV